MKLCLMCIALFSSLFCRGQAQTPPRPGFSTDAEPSREAPPKMATRSQSGAPVRTALPDAPVPTPDPLEINFLTHDTSRGASLANIEWPLNAPNQPKKPEVHIEPYWDKTTIATWGVLAGSMIFDSEITHQGIAHHNCVERNLDVGRYPSRGELYFDNFVGEFAPLFALEWVGGLAMRNGHVNGRFWKSFRRYYPLGPAAYHFEGGAQWLARCW